MEVEGTVDNLKRVHDYAKRHQADLEEGPMKTAQGAVMLAAINKISEKLETIEKTVFQNLENIQALSISVKATEKTVGELSSRVDPLELQLNTLTAENKKLLDKVNEMDAFSRHWNIFSCFSCSC